MKNSNYVDFSKVRKESQEKKFKKFESVEILEKTPTRQKKYEDEMKKKKRLHKRNQNRKKEMMLRRRVTTISALLLLIIGGNFTFNTIKNNRIQDKAYALESNNGESYKYLESLGEKDKENNKLVYEREITISDLGTREHPKPPKASADKYGVLTENSANYVRNIPVLDNINPSRKNRIGKPVKGAVIASTIGESIVVKTTQNGKNFLNMSLRQKTKLTPEQIDNALKGTGLEGLGQAYIDAENQYNVNALFLIGLSCLESNYGNSNFAINRNNITGFRAYTEDPSKAIYYDTKADCINQTASYLNKHYLTKGGKYYNGETMLDANVRYCTSSLWSTKINNIILEKFDDFVE